MNRRKIVGCLLAAVMLIIAHGPASAEDNPLGEYFPYGVYVGGGQSKDAIERVCENLAEHHMNVAWLSNCGEEHIAVWLEAGRKHGIRMVSQGGGPPRFLRPQSFESKEHMVKAACDSCSSPGALFKYICARRADRQVMRASLYAVTASACKRQGDRKCCVSLVVALVILSSA